MILMSRGTDRQISLLFAVDVLVIVTLRASP